MLGILSNGSVTCWGSNTEGTLGDGSNEPWKPLAAVQGINRAKGITADDTYTCVINRDNKILCWGENITRGNASIGNSNIPVMVNTLSNVVQVDGASDHTCALLANGQVWCWGIYSEVVREGSARIFVISLIG